MATSIKFTRHTINSLDKLYLNCVLKRSFSTRQNAASCLNVLQQQNVVDCSKRKHLRLPQRRLLCASQPYCTEAQTLMRQLLQELSHLGLHYLQSSVPVVEDTDEPDTLYRKLLIEVKGHDRKVLHSYEQYVRETAKQMELWLANVTTPKADIFRQAILRSAHIYKKHQVQYEERTYYKVFEFKHLTGSTADTLLEYIQRNLPEGTAMKVTKHQVLPIPQHLKPPTQAKQIDS